MKKIITIYLLVVTLLVGGMTMEAKTTKKKGKVKAKTTQTSSSQWNGDLPSASFLAETFFLGYKNNANKFKEHGYTVMEEYGGITEATKNGVCEIEVLDYARARQLEIIVYDAAKRDWLYNNLNDFIKSKGKRSGYGVTMFGNVITFYLIWR